MYFTPIVAISYNKITNSFFCRDSLFSKKIIKNPHVLWGEEEGEEVDGLLFV